MAGQYLFGIDIGTGGTKTALFDSHGACAGEAFAPSQLKRPVAGAVEEDPEVQVASVLRTIRECIERSGVAPGSVAAVSIDGQMAGVIGVGDDGRNVTPYDSWLDTRCGAYIDPMMSEAGDEILSSTGNTPSFNHGPKILFWKNEHPEVYRQIRSFVQPGAYAAMRLCGLGANQAYIDTTYLHFSGFADSPHARWSSELLATFGVEGAKMPRICSPNEIVGGLSAEAAAQCGLLAGTPVAAGSGDTAASFLSCGAVDEGICVDVAGTASVFASTVMEFRPDRGARIMGLGRSIVPGLWHPYAYINGGGLNLSWFRDSVVSEAIAAATGPAAAGSGAGPLAASGAAGGVCAPGLEELGELASRVPRSPDAPFFVPHLSGRVMPAEPALRGAWVGFSRDHGLGDLYRAVLEGVAMEYGIYLGVIRTLFPAVDLREVRVTGGGEKSTVWNRLKADVCGLPFRTIEESKGAPMGSALLAGFACGLFPDIRKAATSWIRTGEQTLPDETAGEVNARRLERYTELIRVLGEFHRGGQPPR